LIRNLRKI